MAQELGLEFADVLQEEALQTLLLSAYPGLEHAQVRHYLKYLDNLVVSE